MDNESIEKLRNQIGITIESLEDTLQRDPKEIIAKILTRYRRALSALTTDGHDSIDVDCLASLLSCSRGYLEVSSNWDQQFLQDMSETERLISSAI